MALIGFAGSITGQTIKHGPAGSSSAQITSGLAMLVWGPLFGGMYLYLLKKIRGEKATVETVFSGFSHRFLHLFLGGFATGLLTWLGFICCIIPGIYLAVAWTFTLPLIVDKKLDFWSAMELSRKVVTKHWFHFFFFGIFALLYFFLGALAFGVGLFVTIPLVLASLMYAYEDVFGAVPVTTAVPPVMGPFGTAKLPGEPPAMPQATGTVWTRAAKIGLAGVALVIVLFLALLVFRNIHRHRLPDWPNQAFSPRPYIPRAPTVPGPFQPIEASENLPRRNTPHYVFGPVVERELQARASGTNQFLDLDTDQLLTPPNDVSSVSSDILHPFEQDRFWKALDIPQDSRRFKYPKWLEESGADLMYAGDGKIIGFDGVFPVAHGNSSTNWDDWDGMTPELVRNAVAVVEWSRRANEAMSHGQSAPPAPRPGGNFSSAMQLTSQQPGGPLVNLLTRDQSVTWFFKTREGRLGVMQLVSFTDDPPMAKIRYKLLEKTNSTGEGITTPIEADQPPVDDLGDRYQACMMMTDFTAKNNALSSLAKKAAEAGNAKVTGDSLRQITDFTLKSQSALEAVRLLAKRGMRKEALAITKQIDDFTIRDQALSELAQ